MYMMYYTEQEEGRPPIKVKFEIPYFTTSGIQVCLSFDAFVIVIVIVAVVVAVVVVCVNTNTIL